MKKLITWMLLLTTGIVLGQPSVKWNSFTTNSDPVAQNILTNKITLLSSDHLDPWFQPYKIGQVNNRNQYTAWPRLSSAIASSQSQTAPVQIFGWGESGHFQSMYTTLMERIWRVTPCAGIIGSMGNHQTYVFSSAPSAYMTNVTFAKSYLPAIAMEPSSTAKFTNLTCSILDTFATRILEVVFLKTNIGGIFTTYCSSNGGQWNPITFPYQTGPQIGTTTNGYGSQTIRWTNTTFSRPMQLMLSNSSSDKVYIYSLGAFNDAGGGVIANPFMTTGSPHWVGFFGENVDRTNVIKPMWSNWFATCPTLSLYHEFVQYGNYVTYLPQFYDYLNYMNGAMERTNNPCEWVFIGDITDTGEDEDGPPVITFPGAETNFLSSSIELHDFSQTNRLVPAPGLSTNYPWRIGFFDLYGMFGANATNAWHSGLITNVFDLAPTAIGAQNAVNGLYNYLGGDSLFAGRYGKQFVSPSLPAGTAGASGVLQVNGRISSFGSSGGLEMISKDTLSTFRLETRGPSSLNIFFNAADVFAYTNRGGGFEYWRFDGAISPDPVKGFYFINTNGWANIPTFPGQNQPGNNYRGQGILGNDGGRPYIVSPGIYASTAWTATNYLDGAHGYMAMNTGNVVTAASTGPNLFTNFAYAIAQGHIGARSNIYFFVTNGGTYRIRFGAAIKTPASTSNSIQVWTNKFDLSTPAFLPFVSMQADIIGTANYDTGYKEIVATLPAATAVYLQSTNSTATAQEIRNVSFSISNP